MSRLTFIGNWYSNNSANRALRKPQGGVHHCDDDLLSCGACQLLGPPLSGISENVSVGSNIM